MRKPFEPRYDPLRVFADSTTPAGLYARQKWRHEENTEKWANDFKETVKKLRAGQCADGSWGNSEITTIERLFGLHLTVREPDDSIESALAWLLHKSDLSRLAVLPRVASNEVLSGLPFTNGCFEHFVISAGLFLANCFGRGEDKTAVALYDRIAGEVEAKRGCLCNIGCTNNALRAFVVHERYSRKRATTLMVDYLAWRQLASGRWKGRIPFYLTLNALAHLDSDNARHQCSKAIDSVLKAQNRDGTWGKLQKEWNTFLVVHALNRLNV